MNDKQHPSTFLASVATHIKHAQISVYLIGRQPPMTELTVCGVFPHLLVARANGSTHLINPAHISCIRFAPDSEPGRNINHPLYSAVAQHTGGVLRGGREIPGGPRGRSNAR